MDRLTSTSSLRKSFSNEPRKTLSFLTVDDNDEDHSEITTNVEERKSKTEKSVHFADEESVTEDDSSTNDSQNSLTSHDVITWLPSEHLYSEDTFIDLTETGKTVTQQRSDDLATSIPTAVSYGSSTFVDLGSDDDNTNTEQLYSYTDSFESSEVYSGPSVRTSTYKEWKDVTEIVKDIEELEESEFVTRADSLESDLREGDETEASETFDEEIAEAARQDFVSQAIRHLRLKELQSPRSLAVDSITCSSHSVGRNVPPPPPSHTSKEERLFCQRMIQHCRQKSNAKKKYTSETSTPSKSHHPLYQEVEKGKHVPLEFYGLNSALVERLKFNNFQYAFNKKSKDLDAEILSSENFVKHSVAMETIARHDFLSRMCSHVQRVNMDDAIQSHLIKMHPVTQFAQLVSQLPRGENDAREILYEYKSQLEHRMRHRDPDNVS